MSITGPKEPHTTFLEKATPALMWPKYSFLFRPPPITPKQSLGSNSWSYQPPYCWYYKCCFFAWAFFSFLSALFLFFSFETVLCNPGWPLTGTCYATEEDFEFLTLPLPPKYWDYRMPTICFGLSSSTFPFLPPLFSFLPVLGIEPRTLAPPIS